MSVVAEARLHRTLRSVPPADAGADPVPRPGGRVVSLVKGDAGRWWLRTLSPPDLTTWLAARRPQRVPGDDTALAWAWRLDHWATGLPLLGVSALLFLAAAGTRWVACHPARRCLFLFLAAACGTYLWLA